MRKVGLSNRFCLSVCLSVQWKGWNLMIYRVKWFLNPKVALEHTKKSASVYLIATKAWPTSVGSSIFNMVSNSDMQTILAYADAVMACSSKERCKYLHGVFIQRTVEVQVWVIEERSLKVRNARTPGIRPTQVSEERRQRVLQAKKRYNCYTEKYIVIVLR